MEKETKTFEDISDLMPTQSSPPEDCKEEVKDEVLEKASLTFNKTSNIDSQELPIINAKRMRPESEEFTCVICCKEIEVQGIIDNCEHQYCFTCIHRWSKASHRINFRHKIHALYVKDDSAL